ncbi:MAG: YdbH domain-containing protein [Parvularculaceae bacterium]
MRGILTFLSGLAVVLAIIALGVYFFRGPLAGAGLRSALEGMGVQNLSLTIDELSFTKLRARNVKAGADRRNPSVSIDRIEVEFDFARLMRGSVKSIAIGPGSITIAVDDKGAMRIAGAPISLKPSRPQTALPFDSLRFDKLALSIDAPEGSATGEVDGEFSIANGGELKLAGGAAALRVGAWSARDAKFAATVTFAPDGLLDADADVNGDFSTDSIAANGTSLSLAGAARSWRDAISGNAQSVAGSARLNIQITEIPTGASPWFAPLRAPSAAEMSPIEAFALIGEIGVEFAQGRLVIDAGEGAPIRITADRGDTVALSGFDGASLYERDGAQEQISLLAALSGAALTGDARLKARSVTGAGWTFDASSALSAHSIGVVDLGRTTLEASGVEKAGVIEADMTLEALINNAAAGALLISNAPLDADLHLTIDVNAKSIVASTKGERCVGFDRLDFKIAGQDSDGGLTDARLCGVGGPVVSASWANDTQAELMGVLAARDSRYRMAQTRFQGPPPSINFLAKYDGVLKSTTARGALSGGRVVVNKALVATNAEGAFVGTFDAGGLDVDAQLSTIRLSQNAKLEQVAPIMASGMATADMERIVFNFEARTPSGLALGAGEGVHHVRSGRGEASLKTGRIVFTPRTVQPSDIVPGLKGIIGKTDGAIAGDVAFHWGSKPSDFRSTGDFTLDDVSFYGPGRAITTTQGVTGKIELTSLAPLKSNAAQTLSIRLIDLDALKLENGTALFELPGDETVRIINAEFPWFGGKISVNESVADISGASATIVLRAGEIDLGELLEFFKVNGLTGDGVVEGVLPIVFREGKAEISNGVLLATGPGVISYIQDEVNEKLSESSTESEDSMAAMAFEFLKELRFAKLSAELNGPLDGTVRFKIYFEGTSKVIVNGQSVESPFIYRINVDAPLLALVDQARLTADPRLRYERLMEERTSGQ